MDFNFQALFSHINLTNDQMKAILQDFWRKNEENQSEIGKLQQKETESQGEISRLHREIEKHQSEICRLRQENNDHQGENFRPRRENEQYLHEISLFQHENDEILAAEIERQDRQATMLIELSKPSCPVCLENFDSEAHQPYALSCPHMICAECLNPALGTVHINFLVSVERLNDLLSIGRSALDYDHRRFLYRNILRHPSKRCPVCRTEVTTPFKKICLNS